MKTYRLYYQSIIPEINHHGWFPETFEYVDNVNAIENMKIVAKFWDPIDSFGCQYNIDDYLFGIYDDDDKIIKKFKVT